MLTRRLDVTIQVSTDFCSSGAWLRVEQEAFLWSPKADSYMEQISQASPEAVSFEIEAIAAVMDWRDHLSSASIGPRAQKVAEAMPEGAGTC